jgi:uncharacterized radical SAM superfamily protein
MIKIRKITVEPTDVYDITVPATSAFLANNIVVHNCAEIALPTKPLNHIFDGVSRKKIRVPKEKYQEFLKYKKESKNLLYLNKERFNGSTGQ